MTGLDDLLEAYGGCTFEDGLYRIHTRASADEFDRLVGAAFPNYRSRLGCFGFDWLGRQFSIDRSRGVESDPGVSMFEPGTGEVFEVPGRFTEFHDVELVEHVDEDLVTAYFTDWTAENTKPIPFDKCVGYRTPLFLGGLDDGTNVDLTDTSVYWHLMGRLRLEAIRVGLGGRISKIDLGPHD
ncbi:hypothetical protein [Tenggerimyces flavus]|uniref:hypothetical protein n=1 Tax=Tenggerimyces flavus TaxID=1708749 RepID=UPI00195FEC21|nr:hypothetical protein [Tenggerimyces flavus]